MEVAAFVRTNFGYVTGIQLIRPGFSWCKLLKINRRVRNRDRALFFKHLHILLRSGIPLLTALGLLQDKLGREMARVSQVLCVELSKGESFAAALRKEKKIFPQVAVAAVEAGELSGNLTEVLASLQQYFAKQDKLWRFLVNACLYPAILLLFSAVIVVFFIVKVLPLFITMYATFNVEQTLILKSVFALREFVVQHYFNVALLVAGSLGWIWKKRAGLTVLFTWIPWYARLRRLYLEIRFSKLLALLLKSGIPLPEAITTASSTLCDAELQKRCRIFAGSVVRGISLEQAAALAGRLFSATGLAFLKVGENSGTLPEMLAESAAIQEQEFVGEIQNLKTLLEPVLIIVVAGVILLLVMSMIGPLFSLMNQLPEYS